MIMMTSLFLAHTVVQWCNRRHISWAVKLDCVVFPRHSECHTSILVSVTDSCDKFVMFSFRK